MNYPYFIPDASYANSARSLLTFLELTKRLDRHDPRRKVAMASYEFQARILGLL